MEQMLVYTGEDMYVHVKVCVFVQEYAIQWCTRKMQVCAKVHMDM